MNVLFTLVKLIDWSREYLYSDWIINFDLKCNSSTFADQFSIKAKENIWEMANHKSALKRIRSNEAKRLRNRYQHKTTRTYIKRLLSLTDKSEAEKMLSQVSGMIDKLAKNNIIHKNKAANQKSKLAKRVAAL